MIGTRYFVVGGAGFIGSHFVERLLPDPDVEAVTVYDNFSSGRDWHLAAHGHSTRLRVVRGDVTDLDLLTEEMRGHDTVIHLASNPDIARAVTDPAVDFDQGTLLTHHVVEAARAGDVRRLIYASGSGVYGDLGEGMAQEDHGPLEPISTYGASKLAGEALICSYCHLFGLQACALRFANVVGPRQTHGVGFDFVRKLLASPGSLTILGDGSQSKSYIHVQDVVQAALLATSDGRHRFRAYNVATGDHITVREIAELALEVLELPPEGTAFVFTGGDRGWAGDVPIVRMDTSRIRALGWSPSLSSREALRASMRAMLPDAAAGRL
jgi:UDP-glucose 4-epimerase